MKKLAILTFVMFMAGPLPAMVQQQTSSLRQESSADRQQQTQNTKKKPRWYSNNEENFSGQARPEEVELDPLKTEMAAIVKVAESQHDHVSVTDKEEPSKKEHKRICPTCGDLAECCLEDRNRIAYGDIMKCGCRECGGARGLLWAFQRIEDAGEYIAKKLKTFTQGAS